MLPIPISVDMPYLRYEILTFHFKHLLKSNGGERLAYAPLPAFYLSDPGFMRVLLSVKTLPKSKPESLTP